MKAIGPVARDLLVRRRIEAVGDRQLEEHDRNVSLRALVELAAHVGRAGQPARELTDADAGRVLRERDVRIAPCGHGRVVLAPELVLDPRGRTRAARPMVPHLLSVRVHDGGHGNHVIVDEAAEVARFGLREGLVAAEGAEVRRGATRARGVPAARPVAREVNTAEARTRVRVAAPAQVVAAVRDAGAVGVGGAGVADIRSTLAEPGVARRITEAGIVVVAPGRIRLRDDPDVDLIEQLLHDGVVAIVDQILREPEAALGRVPLAGVHTAFEEHRVLLAVIGIVRVVGDEQRVLIDPGPRRFAEGDDIRLGVEDVPEQHHQGALGPGRVVEGCGTGNGGHEQGNEESDSARNGHGAPPEQRIPSHDRVFAFGAGLLTAERKMDGQMDASLSQAASTRSTLRMVPLGAHDALRPCYRPRSQHWGTS